MKAVSHQWVGPTSLSKEMNSWPSSDFDEEFILRWPFDEKPVKNQRFLITRGDGSEIRGCTDDQGRTGLQRSVFTEDVRLTLLPENQ